MPRVPRSFAHLTEIDAVLGGVKSFAVVCARVEDVESLLPDGCANLMPIDGPYHGVKGDGWDNEHRSDADFLRWKGERYAAWKRILASNGTLYDFASPRMGARVEVACCEYFAVIANIVWNKLADYPPGDPRGTAWKARDASSMRGPFPYSERIVMADDGGRGAVEYLRSECTRLGITAPELSGLLGFKPTGGSIAPRRYLSVNGFAPIERHAYTDLARKTGGFARSWESLYRPFNVTAEDQYTDVWTYPTVPHRRDKHPCEKPEAMARDIVRISSRPGDLVLVFFSGSGVFAAEALKQGRRAIAVEMDPRWAEATRARCEAVLRSLS